MIRNNASFYFFDDTDLQRIYTRAFPNVQVFLNLIVF